nr:MAG: hypothetical protein [Lokiarchaeota virus Ratatoskr Meg22_1012]
MKLMNKQVLSIDNHDIPKHCSRINQIISLITEADEEKNNRFKMEYELLRESNDGYVIMINNLRSEISKLKETIKSLKWENNEKQEKITRLKVKLQKIKTTKNHNEKGLLKKISDLNKENDTTLSELRRMVKRNKEFYDETVELKNALSSEFSIVSSTVRKMLIDKITFTEFMKNKIKNKINELF